MSKLFVFGDSYSNDWARMGEMKPKTKQIVYAKEYYKSNKKYPTHFQDVLQQHFNFSIIDNQAVGGLDNYSILEIIGKHIKKIKDEDFVVIGWSDITRIRYIDKTKKWYNRALVNSPDFEKLIPTTLQEQVLLRDSKLPMLEIGSWQNILLKALPYNTVFWSPFIYEDDLHSHRPFVTPHATEMEVEKISEKTNGEIEDSHYSENGHITVGTWLIDIFKHNPYRKKQWL